MPAFLHMQVDGVDLPGGSSMFTELGGVDLTDHTQIVSYYQDIGQSPRASTGHSSPKPTVSPFTIVKSLDGVSPLLVRAMKDYSLVNAQLRFFGPVGISGEVAEHYKIVLLQGRIVGIRTELQNAGTQELPLERVSIAPFEFRHESLLSGQTFTWSPGPES